MRRLDSARSLRALLFRQLLSWWLLLRDSGVRGTGKAENCFPSVTKVTRIVRMELRTSSGCLLVHKSAKIGGGLVASFHPDPVHELSRFNSSMLSEPSSPPDSNFKALDC